MELYEREKVIEEFVELVTTFSASRNERKIGDLLLEKLQEIGCVDLYEDNAGQMIGGNTGNIYGILPGTLPGSILFCAHMDRGELLPKRDGTIPEIRPQIREGRIYSDGTTLLAADDVAGIVSILTALRHLKTSSKPHCSVEVLFTVCEEDAALGSCYADYSRIQSKLAYAMDSNGPLGRIVNGAPSGAKLKVELFGRGAHYGSAPENGRDAALAAAELLCGLRQGRIDEDTVANFPVLHAGGEATYGICEYAVLKGQAQSHNPEKLSEYIRYFERFCCDKLEPREIQWEFENQILYHAYVVPPESACVRLVSKALENLGEEAYTELGNACLDSHHLNAHGIESVALGMGYRLNHSNQEYQEIDLLLKNSQLIENILLEYGNNPTPYTILI